MGIGSILGKIIFFLVGVACIVGGYFLYRGNASFNSTAASATGHVVRVNSSVSYTGNNPTTVYAPVVDFTTASGQSIEFQGSSSSTTYTIGQTVSVHYQPSSPNEAKIASPFLDTYVPIGLMIMGALFVLFSPFAQASRRRAYVAVGTGNGPMVQL